MQLTKWVHEATWVSKVKVIHWPWSKVTQIQHFKFLFLTNCLADWNQILCGAAMGWGLIDCANGPGYMTSMAAMSIYGKNFKKYSSLETKGWWPWKLVCSIWYSSSTKFVQMMTLGWPILRQSQIWSRMLLYGKKVKQWIFQKLL